MNPDRNIYKAVRTVKWFLSGSPEMFLCGDPVDTVIQSFWNRCDLNFVRKHRTK